MVPKGTTKHRVKYKLRQIALTVLNASQECLETDNKPKEKSTQFS